MSRVVLVHWQAGEAEQRAERLREAGLLVDVHCRHDAGGELTRLLAADLPDAVVIDLGRLPAHGRAVAQWLRGRKASRRVPIVFVPGDPTKTARVREAFPDAPHAEWPVLAKALRHAIAHPVADPVVPSAPDYSGTPLPRKLGVRAAGVLMVARAPDGLADLLGEMPERARVVTRWPKAADVVVLFCRSLAHLEADWPKGERVLAPAGSLWVAWQKRSSGAQTDLGDAVVRTFGLARGLVDTKVCAIDAEWSALRFSRRRS